MKSLLIFCILDNKINRKCWKYLAGASFLVFISDFSHLQFYFLICIFSIQCIQQTHILNKFHKSSFEVHIFCSDDQIHTQHSKCDLAKVLNNCIETSLLLYSKAKILLALNWVGLFKMQIYHTHWFPPYLFYSSHPQMNFSKLIKYKFPFMNPRRLFIPIILFHVQQGTADDSLQNKLVK